MITLKDIEYIYEWCKDRKNNINTPVVIPENLYNDLVSKGVINKDSTFIIPNKTIPDDLLIFIDKTK